MSSILRSWWRRSGRIQGRDFEWIGILCVNTICGLRTPNKSVW
jgi:hypothetical protein